MGQGVETRGGAVLRRGAELQGGIAPVQLAAEFQNGPSLVVSFQRLPRVEGGMDVAVGVRLTTEVQFVDAGDEEAHDRPHEFLDRLVQNLGALAQLAIGDGLLPVRQHLQHHRGAQRPLGLIADQLGVGSLPVGAVGNVEIAVGRGFDGFLLAVVDGPQLDGQGAGLVLVQLHLEDHAQMVAAGILHAVQHLQGLRQLGVRGPAELFPRGHHHFRHRFRRRFGLRRRCLIHRRLPRRRLPCRLGTGCAGAPQGQGDQHRPPVKYGFQGYPHPVHHRPLSAALLLRVVIGASIGPVGGQF
ncbi:hypothetical protein AZA_90558 [Nitrospirillum viridazoti Y2]|nr:hypothetical protein AZA_90558 [Nitrospirillum amazonense Y2]